jgi:hypothetical protein
MEEIIMIGEVIRMENEEGKLVFGLLIEREGIDGKFFIPCNDLLWTLKREELHNIPLIPQKVEIKFVED